jgi:plastocyanin
MMHAQWKRQWLAIICGAAAWAGPARAGAQAAVSGRVSIQERPGESTKDIGNTVIYLLAADGRALRYGSTKVPIAMTGKEFIPHVRVITPGSAVEYPNQDPFSHNIFSTAVGAAFDLGTYPNGVARTATFRKTGAFPIYCNIHSRMTAFVVVVPTPYHTMAGNDGRWSIPNVAPGAYDLHVWHERAPAVVTRLTVAAAGAPDIATALDARGFVATAHKNKFGKEYTSTGKDRY